MRDGTLILPSQPPSKLGTADAMILRLECTIGTARWQPMGVGTESRAQHPAGKRGYKGSGCDKCERYEQGDEWVEEANICCMLSGPASGSPQQGGLEGEED